uniref:Homocitrate synthase n=1 Tax=Ganoderma boninense TaxID=34458 RepID=A0A5K1JZI7_9APHY|nr:Homocitrate synthase [Ganoderma boninense]
MQEQSVPIYAVMDRICKVKDWYRDRAGDAAPERDLHMLKTLTGVGYYGAHAHYPAGPNVLCNMSKGECVRETALVELQSRYPVTLAHAALSRICYSQDPSMAMACSEKVEKQLVKGPWAGDRLRIMSADDMPPLHGGKEWKDVTEEVNRMLRHLWRANDILSDDEDESDEEEEEKEEGE